MTTYQGDHKGLSRARSNKPWKQAQRAGTALLITSLLTLAICTWLTLVLPSKQHCVYVPKWLGSPSGFPWEPDQKPTSNWSTIRAPASTIKDLNLSHLVFGIAGSAELWPKRKEYVKLWWKPREMRGFVWLERGIKQGSEGELPAVVVSKAISRFSYTNPTGHPSGIRIARIIQEAFHLNLPDVCWFVLGDDDTVFSPKNLLHVLKKYDHKELFYIGNPSESHSSNTYFSHGMAFGGGGIAISYPLAEALTRMLDGCLERYPFLFGSDDRLHACITELGVPLTREPGFHQFDVHGNPFGLLAAHPIAPFVSMHHLDEVDPVFPGLDNMDGIRHLTKAMQTEPSTFLQRSICYDHSKKLTFAISSGYVVQVYPYVLLPREIERPEITFKAWNKKGGGGEFDLDTRMAIKWTCRKPYLFFLEKIEQKGQTGIGLYARDTSIDRRKKWSFCFSYMHRPEEMLWIRIVTKPLDDNWFKVPRRQCCKVMNLEDRTLNISVSPCVTRKSSSS